MAVKVSYPGVYIEEFAPGGPIEGVGTSTAAFIGTATRGPIKKPTLIESWDAFKSTFGDIVAEPPASYLAPAVYGFFLNGGTTCYVVRASQTAKMSEAKLDSRQGGANPEPVLLARALEEGPGGDAITVDVVESSRLATALATALPARAITAITGGRKILTVGSNQGYTGGEVVTVSTAAGASQTAIVESVQDSDKLILVAALTGTTQYTTVAPAGVLAVRRTETDVTAMAANRASVTVVANRGFAPGDKVLVTKTGAGGGTAVGFVKALQGTNTLELTAPLTGTVNFGTGTVTVRTADLAPGQRTLRLAVPAALQLGAALPRGTAVAIAGATTHVHVIESSGGDTITLTDGLTVAYSMSAPATPPTVASLEFDLIVTDTATGNDEEFVRLGMHPDNPNYWRTAVVSELVTIEEPAAPPSPMPEDRRPVAKRYQLSGGQSDDRGTAMADVRANPNAYLDLLKPYDEVSLVCIPGETDKAVQQAIRDHCEKMHDRFAILDSHRDEKAVKSVEDQFGDVRSALGFAALYYPWIVARNPVNGQDELWPPSGHIAGVYARTDMERGVHKAPANANVRGALGVQRLLTDEQQGRLNLMGINVLRVFAGQSQPLVWGARTTTGDLDTNWQYVNVRRLFLFLEESIQRSIRWAVFEPNNLQLWQKLKRTITEFLTRVWRDGALFGAKAEDAFYVRIDEALNPPSTQALGRLYIEIGVRPTYPAEFIVVRIGIWQGGSDVSES
jgi:phage tail sheath protein FI